jgi:hypothetical protein
MPTDTAIQPPPSPRRSPVLTSIASLGLIAGVIGAVLGYVGLREARRSSQALAHITQHLYELEAYHSFLSNTLAPDVGVMQFLENGLSVTLQAVEYRGEGLYLRGQVGNPRVVKIANATLKVRAYPPLHKIVQQESPTLAEEDSFAFVVETGEGQSNVIAQLNPGGTASFEVTIPNVKQTPEGLLLAVETSGEQFAY